MWVKIHQTQWSTKINRHNKLPQRLRAPWGDIAVYLVSLFAAIQTHRYLTLHSGFFSIEKKESS